MISLSLSWRTLLTAPAARTSASLISCSHLPWEQVRNFKAAIEMFGRVADIAEAEGHHPDLHLVGYNSVSIELTTHAVGNDFSECLPACSGVLLVKSSAGATTAGPLVAMEGRQ